MKLSKRTKKQIDHLLKNNGEHWLKMIERGLEDSRAGRVVSLEEYLRGVEQPGSSHGS
jgi:predicted transcriptional regulator